MMSRRLSPFLLLAAGVLGVGGTCLQADTPTPVRVVDVVWSTDAVPIEAIGLLSRRFETTLAFKIPGMIEAVLVRAGDTVTRGQILARLRLDEIEAQLVQAQRNEEKSRRDLARIEQLAAASAVSQEELQNARTGLELGEAQLRVIRFNRRYAEIVAPDDGTILARSADPDQWAGAGQTIIGFGSNRSGWRVRSQLAEVDARRLAVGDRATIEGIVGTVSRISDALDPVTRTVAVEIDCDEGPPDARSNRVVALKLRPRPVASRPCVPVSALIAGNGGRHRIFLLAADSARVVGKEVDVASLQGESAFLRTALSREHAHVVMQGAEYLRDGATIVRVESP